jgi:hypothetical protein
MFLVAYHLCVEALLIQVSHAVVPLVEALRVDAVEAVHAERDVFERRLDDQVKVVVEQAVGVEPPAKARCGFGQEPQPASPVDVVEDDRHPRDAANGQVVSTGGRQNTARQAGHAFTVEPKRTPENRRASVVTDMSRGQSPRHALFGPRRFGRRRDVPPRTR